MKMISILELKQHLSSLVDEASRGARILITRHRKPVATIGSAELNHLHIGKRAGKASLKPLLHRATRGRYIEVLQDDRRGEAERS